MILSATLFFPRFIQHFPFSKRLEVNANVSTKAQKRGEIVSTNQEIEESRKLAVQAANGTYNNSDRDSLKT